MNYTNLGKLDELLNNLMNDGIAAGLNIAVVTPEQKWMKTYGNRQNVPTVEKATIDTIWDLASCSKVLVTTTCILKLREEGLLDLDTKVKDILPKLEDEEVTVLQLINHSSGFHPDIVGYKAMTPEEMRSYRVNSCADRVRRTLQRGQVQRHQLPCQPQELRPRGCLSRQDFADQLLQNRRQVLSCRPARLRLCQGLQGRA